MARYRVIGATLETGEDVDVVIEAATPQQASERAQRMRIAVRSIDIEAAAPVAVQSRSDQGSTAADMHVTVERTARDIKRRQVRAALLVLGGLILFCASPSLRLAPPGRPDNVATGFGAAALLVALGGLIWMIKLSVERWWRHG